MPFYDYHCEDCESTFEVKRCMSEASTSRAPTCDCCGSRDTRRVFGNFAASTGGTGSGTASGPT